MLHRRIGRTSLVLLFHVVIPEITLPLGRHPPLDLHNLFRLVRATRRGGALARVEALGSRTSMVANLVKHVHRVGARCRSGNGVHAVICGGGYQKSCFSRRCPWKGEANMVELVLDRFDQFTMLDKGRELEI
jgi:hypothetical protein